MKKFLLISAIISIAFMIFYFYYPYSQINKDLTIWIEEGEYVGYIIFYADGKVHISQKQLDKNMAEKYKEILQNISNIRVLSKRQFQKKYPIVTVTFIPMLSAPTRLQFTQYYYSENGYYFTFDNYAEIYDQLITLTQDYLKKDAEIIEL